MSQGFWREGRILAFLGLLAVGNLFIGGAILWLLYGPGGQATVVDFWTFWSAGRFAIEGDGATAYDKEAMQLMLSQLLGQPYERRMDWISPPVFQLVMAPFAMLPLWLAQALWVLGGAGFYLAVAFWILPRPVALAVALAPLTTMLLLVNGQTGFITAALVGLSLLAVALQERGRPLGAAMGIPLGLLCIKPQLALALPLFLLIRGEWRAIFWAAGTVLACLGLATLVLGIAVWPAFLDGIAASVGDMANRDGLPLQATLRAALVSAGVSFGAAGIAQLLLSLTVLGLLTRALLPRGEARPTPAMAGALVAYATVAANPRVMDYDLLILAIGALLHARHLVGADGCRPALAPWEGPAFLVAVLLPLLDFPPSLALEVNFAIGPLLFASALGAERWRRAQSRAQSRARSRA
ncbi:MAG: glycosyltransferase family 87 protein [Pseudomonadota bacterium]